MGQFLPVNFDSLNRNLFRTCTGYYSTTYSSSWVASAVGLSLSTGTIIGIVVGSLVGVAVLVGFIVLLVCLCNKKPRQVWAVQSTQQAMIHQAPPQAHIQMNHAYYPPPPYAMAPPGKV